MTQCLALSCLTYRASLGSGAGGICPAMLTRIYPRDLDSRKPADLNDREIQIASTGYDADLRSASVGDQRILHGLCRAVCQSDYGLGGKATGSGSSANIFCRAVQPNGGIDLAVYQYVHRISIIGNRQVVALAIHNKCLIADTISLRGIIELQHHIQLAVLNADVDAAMAYLLVAVIIIVTVDRRRSCYTGIAANQQPCTAGISRHTGILQRDEILPVHIRIKLVDVLSVVLSVLHNAATLSQIKGEVLCQCGVGKICAVGLIGSRSREGIGHIGENTGFRLGAGLVAFIHFRKLDSGEAADLNSREIQIASAGHKTDLRNTRICDQGVAHSLCFTVRQLDNSVYSKTAFRGSRIRIGRSTVQLDGGIDLSVHHNIYRMTIVCDSQIITLTVDHEGLVADAVGL